MRNEYIEPCEFCKDKVSGDSFFIMKGNFNSGFNFEKHTMQYCPKCGKKLPENGIGVAVVIPMPQNPFPKRKKQFNLAFAQ